MRYVILGLVLALTLTLGIVGSTSEPVHGPGGQEAMGLIYEPEGLRLAMGPHCEPNGFRAA